MSLTLKFSCVLMLVWLLLFFYSIYIFDYGTLAFQLLVITNALIIFSFTFFHDEIVTKMKNEAKQAELSKLKDEIFRRDVPS